MDMLTKKDILYTDADFDEFDKDQQDIPAHLTKHVMNNLIDDDFLVDICFAEKKRKMHEKENEIRKSKRAFANSHKMNVSRTRYQPIFPRNVIRNKKFK